MTHWQISKYERMSRAPEGELSLLSLPECSTTHHHVRWVYCRHGQWVDLDSGHVLDVPTLAHCHPGNKWMVGSCEEAQQLLGILPPDTLVMSLQDYGVAPIRSVKSLLEVRAYLQEVARVDFSLASPYGSWRKNALSTLRRRWGKYARADIQRWVMSMDVHPWQEARRAYWEATAEQPLGFSWDLRSAYSHVMENEVYPFPGASWRPIPNQQDVPWGLYLVRWQPHTAQGRFFHAFRYRSHTRVDYMGLSCEDSLEAWVLGAELPWLRRHGRLYMSQGLACTQMGPHPLKGKVEHWWKKRIHDDAQYMDVWKRKLAMAHTWSWSPRTQYIPDNPDALISYFHRYAGVDTFLRDYHHTWKKWSDLEGPPALSQTDWVVKGLDWERSGWYLPVFWTRLHMRALMTRAVEWFVDHQFEVANVNVDGLHVLSPCVFSDTGAIAQYLEHHGLRTALGPYPWKVEALFEKGVWLRPSWYGLSHKRQWKGPLVEKEPKELFTALHWYRWITPGAHRLDVRGKNRQAYWWRASDIARWQQYPSPPQNHRWLMHQVRAMLE